MDRHFRAANNICYDCHESVKPGYKRCEKHLAANNLKSLEYSKRPRGMKTKKNYKSTVDYKTKDLVNIKKYKRTSGRFNSAVGYAKHRGKIWKLSKEEYLDLISKPCYYCNLINDVETGVGLDRIDNSKGYIAENCLSCCALCNMTRGDRFSVQEMKSLGEVIRKIKQTRIESQN